MVAFSESIARASYGEGHTWEKSSVSSPSTSAFAPASAAPAHGGGGRLTRRNELSSSLQMFDSGVIISGDLRGSATQISWGLKQQLPASWCACSRPVAAQIAL